MTSLFLSIILSLATALHTQIGRVEASFGVGVCYGMVGDNLPSSTAVVDLYKKYEIGSMRLFKPNHDILKALGDSDIIVSLGMLDEDIPNIASSPDAASAWFKTNIAPYEETVEFRYIIVGNEAIPGKFANSITPAMQNLQKVIDSEALIGITKISTAVALSVLGSSYPPSAGAFSDAAAGPMRSVLNFLSNHSSELLINVYPYFSYASDPAHISLDYAQFTASESVVVDGNLGYQNLFDAMVDAVYWALEKVGISDVNVAIAETGWPSAGNGNFTTAELAGTYNRNFLKHIANFGTPKRPNASIDGYVLAMFNEDLKPTGVDQNFGLFYATGEPIYPVLPINYTNLD